MSEVITVIGTSDASFPISVGERTLDLLSRQHKLTEEGKETLLGETREILSYCINPVNTTGSVTNLVVGYVQSGKTLSFTTLTTLAIDNGFRIVIYFAGVKNNLLAQTTNRLKKDLDIEGSNSRIYRVFDNPTIESGAAIASKYQLSHKPAILITVLKHSKHIDELAKIFSTPALANTIKNQGVLIIDDEADQASLNTYARKNSKSQDWEDEQFSSIHSSILKLKNTLPNHSYIQYTATPQGPLLINLMDLLSPKHHTVLTPGETYTGGKVFFKEHPDLIITIPDEQVYHQKHNPLSACPDSLIAALQVFFVGTAIAVSIENKERFLSMMVHADRETDASRKFRGWINSVISSWGDKLALPDGDPAKTELLEEFKISYNEAVRRLKTPPSFEEVVDNLHDIIMDTNVELVIQGNQGINWSNAAAHILIGAEMLNRGFTVENLAVTYMPRYSVGKSTADTIQQRCRFFGYKRNYLDFCRVYLPQNSIEEYVDYVEHEEIMRTWLKEQDSLERVEQILILDPSMNATRSNILSVNVVRHKLSGWRQFNALQNREENIRYVEEFLSTLDFTNYREYGTTDRDHRYVKMDIQDVIDFLRGFKLSNIPDSLRKVATMQYLKYLANEKGVTHAYIIQMAYKRAEGRVRKLDTDTMKINNIFSGPDPKGRDIYPGDKAIKFEDGVCFQIHKIKLEHPSIKWGNKICYTLGAYYPEDFAHAFVGVDNFDQDDDDEGDL
jgi:hypothetical protein